MSCELWISDWLIKYVDIRNKEKELHLERYSFKEAVELILNNCPCDDCKEDCVFNLIDKSRIYEKRL